MIEADEVFYFEAHAVTNREIEPIDQYLNDVEQTGIWKSVIGQQNLAYLLELREKAFHAYKQDDMPLMEANIEALFAWCTHLHYHRDAHPRAIKGTSFMTRQKEKSRLPRSSIEFDGEKFSIGHIVRNLAQKRDALGDPIPARDLWNELFGELDNRGMYPHAHDKNKNPVSISYTVDTDDGRADYKFSSFKATISRANKKS